MILIGQYDSPFCRRVGIALRLYGFSFEHRPWSTFGDADSLGRYNPLLRVPTLVLTDGTTLVDSHGILDHLDELAGAEKSLMASTLQLRGELRRVIGLSAGISDKAVALFYEKVLHSDASQMWLDRCTSQITGSLAALEADRAARPGQYWFEDRITHADIMVAATLDHLTSVHPQLFDPSAYPALQKHLDGMRALPVFQEIHQPFIPPK